MKDVLFYQNYVPTGDVISIALCIVVGLLMRSTYTMKRANLRIFTNCNRLTAIAATSNLVYHTLLKNMVVETVPFIYFFRAMAYILLVWTYVCFCIYIGNIVELEGKNLKVFRGLVLNAGVLFSLAQLVGPFIKIGFYIDDALKVHQNYYFDFFRLAYIYYSVTLFVLLLLHHKKVIRKVMQCLWCVLTLSFSIMVYQAFFLQTSYTVATFAVVIIALLFLFHYNAYDVETGTMDQYAFDEFLDDCREKNYSLISLSLPAISKDRMRKFSYDFLRKNGRYFRGSYCFRLRSNRIILVYQKEKNKNYKEILDKMFNDFIQIKERDKYDYYVTLMDDIEPFTFGSELIYFCEYLENHMHLNKIKFCTNDDIEAFYKFRELFNELKDIYLKEDLNDSRVKVYCQPVLNTKTNTL